MRLLLRLFGYALLAFVLLVACIIGDIAFDKRRLLYVLLGREALVSACRPALMRELATEGFEPAELEFGEQPDIAVSTATGRSLTDSFTFEDGASASRIDGDVTCRIAGAAVSVEVRTATTPMRAT